MIIIHKYENVLCQVLLSAISPAQSAVGLSHGQGDSGDSAPHLLFLGWSINKSVVTTRAEVSQAEYVVDVPPGE